MANVLLFGPILFFNKTNIHTHAQTTTPTTVPMHVHVCKGSRLSYVCVCVRAFECECNTNKVRGRKGGRALFFTGHSRPMLWFIFVRKNIAWHHIASYRIAYPLFPFGHGCDVISLAPLCLAESEFVLVLFLNIFFKRFRVVLFYFWRISYCCFLLVRVGKHDGREEDSRAVDASCSCIRLWQRRQHQSLLAAQ